MERQKARREAGIIAREYVRMIESLARNHIKGMFGSRSIRDLGKGSLDDGFMNLPKHRSTKTKYNIQGLSLNYSGARSAGRTLAGPQDDDDTSCRPPDNLH